MIQLERIYVTKNNFDTRSQQGAKFTHEIHKIEIIIRHITRAP